jgi:hypothetical protein
VWHWTSCIWFFIDSHKYKDVSGGMNWFNQTGADSVTVVLRWLYSLEFTMSIATTTGYAEQRIYSDFERIIFHFVVYILNSKYIS